MQIPVTALTSEGVHATNAASRVSAPETSSGATFEISSKANEPIEDKAEFTREGLLQNQLLRGLNIMYSWSRTPLTITPENMDKAISDWASHGNLSTDDVKIIAVAFAYAEDNGYDFSQVAAFESDYSFWAGVNKKLIGDGPASKSDAILASKFIGSQAFETSKLPKDFLLMSFDPQHPTATGADAKFVADFARYLSDAPEADFDGNASKANNLLRDYRERLDW